LRYLDSSGPLTNLCCRDGRSLDSAMHGYYAYIIGQDGRIKDRKDLICETEDEAKERARQLVDGHAVELWKQARKIVRFEPDHSSP
jgi:hypothetical protein